MTSALAVESKCHDPFRHDPQLGQLRPGKRHVVFLPLRCKDSSSRVKTRSTQVNSSSIAQCKIAAVFGAVTLATFFAAGQQYELSPQEYLQRNLASSWLLPVLLHVPLALILVPRGSCAI